MLSLLQVHLKSRLKWLIKPYFALQDAPTDCGFVCASLLLKIFRLDVPVVELKQKFGHITRGLKVSQVREILKNYDLDAQVVTFDTANPNFYRTPSILLTKKSHYILAYKITNKKCHYFDPEVGWRTQSFSEFSERLTGLSVEIKELPLHKVNVPENKSKSKYFLQFAFRQATSKLGLKGLGLVAAVSLFNIAAPFFTQEIVDRSSISKTDNVQNFLFLLFAISIIASSSLSVISQLILRKITAKMRLRAETTLLSSFSKKKSQWFDAQGNSYLYNQFIALNSVQGFYSGLFVQLVSIVVLSIGATYAIFSISPILFLPSLVATIASVLIDYLFQNTLQVKNSSLTRVKNQHREFFYEALTQLPTFIRFNELSSIRAVLGKKTKTVLRTENEKFRVDLFRNTLQRFASTLDNLVFIFMASFFVQNNAGTLGNFVAVSLFKDLLASSVRSVFDLFNQYSLIKPQQLQINGLLDNVESTQPKHNHYTASIIEFKNVDFSFNKFAPPLFSNVSFQINEGDLIAINGPSGSGKSTLIKLIAGILTCTKGIISIKQEKMEETLVHVILQSDQLMMESIRDNITLFNKGYTDEEIYNALEIVELKEMVLNLPMRLDSVVGEKYGGLSGGQRQRIILSRALLRKPTILILDEATSNLDLETEARLISRLKQLQITLILCSHRREVWEHANQIIEVSNNGIVKSYKSNFKHDIC